MGCASGAGQGLWTATYTQGGTSSAHVHALRPIAHSRKSHPSFAVQHRIQPEQAARQERRPTTEECSSAPRLAPLALNRPTKTTPRQSQMLLVIHHRKRALYRELTPGLYMPNWPRGTLLHWDGQANPTLLRAWALRTCKSSCAKVPCSPDAAAANTSANPSAVYVQQGYASWMKGVKIVGQGPNDILRAVRQELPLYE